MIITYNEVYKEFIYRLLYKEVPLKEEVDNSPRAVVSPSTFVVYLLAAHTELATARRKVVDAEDVPPPWISAVQGGFSPEYLVWESEPRQLNYKLRG